MAELFYEKDADLSLIQGKKVAELEGRTKDKEAAAATESARSAPPSISSCWAEKKLRRRNRTPGRLSRNGCGSDLRIEFPRLPA